MAEDNGKQWPKFRKNEYGHTEPTMTSHVFEGGHGYENIIGMDEVPTKMFEACGLPPEEPAGNPLGKHRRK